MTPPSRAATRAVIFDFNGTISDDEAVIERVFRELFAGLGIVVSGEDYYGELAGFSDPEIVSRGLAMGCLELGPERRAQLLRSKIDRYMAIVSAQPTIADSAAGFVRAAAARVPVAIASGAAREEVEHVLALADLGGVFAAVVCIDDVERGKPDPQGYEAALSALNRSVTGPPVRPREVLVFEDSDAGVQAAKAAGMRCVALLGPAYTGVPVAADSTVETLDPALVDALLAPR